MLKELKNLLCPKCGQKMVSRKSKFGIFWGCSQYPKCDGKRDNEGRSHADRDKERLEDEDGGDEY